MAGPSSAQPNSVAVKELATNPGAFVDRPLKVSGTLENAGRNYFTDLKVVLTDEEDNFVYVKPWLPIETPPAPPGGRERETLSEYLDQRVELTGNLKLERLKNVGRTYVLNVSSAKILPEEE